MEENQKHYICNSESSERIEVTGEEYEKLLHGENSLSGRVKKQLQEGGYLCQVKKNRE